MTSRIGDPRLRPSADPLVYATGPTGGCHATVLGVLLLSIALAILVVPPLLFESRDLRRVQPDGCYVYGLLAFGTLLLVRTGRELHLRTRRLVRWWGFLWPMYRSEIPLDTCRVVLQRSVAEGAEFPIQLRQPNARLGNPLLDIADDYETGRAKAIGFAELLGLDLVDTTTGEEVQLATAGDLPVPAPTDRADAAVGAGPPGMRTQVDRQADTLTLGLPAVGYPWQLNLMMLSGVIVEAFALASAISSMKVGDFVFALVIGLPFLLTLTIPAWNRARTRQTVIVGPDGVTLESRGFRVHRQSIARDAIIEVRCGGHWGDVSSPGKLAAMLGQPNSVIVLSAHDAIAFGGHLDRRESMHLRALVEAALQRTAD